MFGGRTYVPTDLAVLAESWSTFRGSVGDDAGTGRSKGYTIEIMITKQRGMSGKRGMRARGTKQV